MSVFILFTVLSLLCLPWRALATMGMAAAADILPAEDLQACATTPRVSLSCFTDLYPERYSVLVRSTAQAAASRYRASAPAERLVFLLPAMHTLKLQVHVGDGVSLPALEEFFAERLPGIETATASARVALYTLVGMVRAELEAVLSEQGVAEPLLVLLPATDLVEAMARGLGSVRSTAPTAPTATPKAKE